MPLSLAKVVVGNSLLSVLIVLRSSQSVEIDEYFEGNNFFLSVIVCIEVSSFSLAVVFAGALSGWIGQRAELGRENSRMSSDLSAVSMLLRLMSDAVVELDQDLRLLRHSPELSAMLMRDRPGSSLEGLAFTEFVHSSEATRAWELLKNPSHVLSAGQGTSAHAFHTRLVDTFANKVCVEVFHVQVLNSEGEIRHLLGLRDFTDSSSLSGERATDAMDSSGPVSPVSPTQSYGLYEIMSSPMRSQTLSISDQEWGTTHSQRQAFLEVDMEVKVVHCASASVSFLAGSSLADFFTVPHTVQLLQRICDEAQRGLDQEGALPQKVFNYQDLPVRWGSGHYGSIHGTFQVVLCRFGRIGCSDSCFDVDTVGAIPQIAAQIPVFCAVSADPKRRDLRASEIIRGKEVRLETGSVSQRGAEIRILSGEVCIRGALVMGGYEHHGPQEEDPNAEAWTEGSGGSGFLRTGDLGHMDQDGWLYLTGRCKEMINRGGETINPHEVEPALTSTPGVDVAVCFAAPHQALGECIAVALALEDGLRPEDVPPKAIVDHSSKQLSEVMRPEVFVYLPRSMLPTTATKKFIRAGLAKRPWKDRKNEGLFFVWGSEQIQLRGGSNDGTSWSEERLERHNQRKRQALKEVDNFLVRS
ncbi:unnamed protein product [Symbiodinium sp. CCMP2592]|nr:unnamed protein product [Symbiodinium sp. CCMP2592]